MFVFVNVQAIVILIVIIILGLLLGRKVASGLKADQQKMVGFIALLVGVILIVWGYTSLTSMSGQLMREMGRTPSGALFALGFGALVLTSSITLLISGSDGT